MSRHARHLAAIVVVVLVVLTSAGVPTQAAQQPAPPGSDPASNQPFVGPTPAADAPSAPAGEGGGDTAVPDEMANVPGVTADWWAAVQEQIRGDLYALTPDEAQGGADAYRGYNPDHRFEFSFAAGGLRLAPSASPEATEIGPSMDAGPAPAPAPSWTWELRTTGYGYQGDVRSLTAPEETTSGANRLELDRGDLTEWYVNDERGLEQGFTVEAPPPGTGKVLVLEMALDSDLVPLVATDQAIEFTQPEGNVVLLRYSDLYAYDAQGTSLPARMALSGCDRDPGPGSCRLQLLVEVAGAPFPLRIDPLLTVPDWAAVGENSSDNFGYSVAPAGDVNGDGFADLVIGAWGYDSWGMESNGKAYVYHGSPAGLSDTPAWWQTGEEIANEFGHSVATAGDVNGDGYADLVVGARGYDSSRGKVYVYHGSPAGLGDQAAWSRAGDAGELFGHSVSTAGDLNGDGYDDIVVGAPYNGTDDTGAVSVYLGSPAGLIPGSLDWYGLGEAALDTFGWSVATAGDLNGDGYADLVVGAPGKDCTTDGPWNCGGAYVYYGQAGGLTQDDPADWIATGQNEDDLLGFSVGTAGDVNGDGISDLVVTAAGSWPDPGASWCTGLGEAYVYHGSQAGLTPGDPPAWTASGENATDLFGSAAGTIGDVNGDGYDDLVVGAPGWDCSLENPQAWDCGKAYVFHGSTVGLGAIPTWTVAGENAGDQLGFAAATAGDTNGDGYDDLVVGAPGYDIERGKAYVFHGTSLGLTPSFDWTAAGEEAHDFFGSAVVTAGDVDGDGFADLVVGAYGYDGERGKAYLFPGTPAGLATTPDWSAEGEMPGDRFGRSVAAAGDVNGDGYH
ncbi:MAG: integrin alpha, partial [Anaerolineae bacterium]